MLYVIQVQTGKENDIAGKLKELGIKAYVPKENRIIRSGGSWTKKEYVLFSGYVFLNIHYDAETYYKVKNIPAVIRFLGDSNNPSRLSYLETEWIRILTGENNVPIEPSKVKLLENGEVEIVDGVLKEFKMSKMDKRNRKAVFEITICGEKKEVQLSIEIMNDKQPKSEADKNAATDVVKEE